MNISDITRELKGLQEISAGKILDAYSHTNFLILIGLLRRELDNYVRTCAKGIGGNNTPEIRKLLMPIQKAAVSNAAGKINKLVNELYFEGLYYSKTSELRSVAKQIKKKLDKEK